MTRHHNRRMSDRLEDLEFMATTDETLTGAARRIGVERRSLERWLENNGHTDILNSLRGRDDPQGEFGERAVASRATNVTPIRADVTDMIPVDEQGNPCVSSQDLMAAAGITYRQLDYWARTGRLNAWEDPNVKPDGPWARRTGPTPGSGHPRWFPADEVLVATWMGVLLHAGLTLAVAHQAARELAAEGHADLGPFHLTIRQENQPA